MPRRLPGLVRALGGGSLASVAFGEVGSSIYFALGIIALFALGLTPWVLLGVGTLFMLVALSYAEGTAAIPETGGAAMLARRAFNDPLGFLTGWVLLLDYTIVIALAALFAPHYFGHAVGWERLTRHPWDVVAAVFLILGITVLRLVRRPGLYRIAVAVAAVAFISQLILIALGFGFLFSFDDLTHGIHPGVAPTWHSLVFALPLAMLAYTGLETVANLAQETVEPGKTIPRSLFGGLGAAVLLSAVIGIIGIAAFPAVDGPSRVSTLLGSDWLRAPLVGIVAAFEGELPGFLVDVIRVLIGLTGAGILIAAATTSISGIARVVYSLGRHQMLPHTFGTFSRRSTLPPAAILGAAAVSSTLVILAASVGKEVRFLGSLYSFGVLITFTIAQAAVVKLRFSEPNLERPFVVPINVRVRGRPVPVAALIGIPLTAALWGVSFATHDAARIGGPAWLVLGAALYVAARVRRGSGLLKRVEAPTPDLVPAREGEYVRILVPVKIGLIGEEMLATAIKLAEERGGSIYALHAIRVPLDLPLDAQLLDQEERASASLIDAKLLASEHGIQIEGDIVRARAIGEAIVAKAEEIDADLILMGSAPRWRRQSRFFSPTVDYVLRRAPCEVMVIAYPQGVLEDELAPQV
ncbi:MAG TPA: universal stress protein [Gaiellaceae bacterium]|nr:universal stress protein [Gaiellaceae bacterium]